MEDAEFKFGDNGEDMVEDIGLDIFVVGPGFIAAEAIDFDGDSIVGGGEMAHEEGHILIDFGVIFEIFFEVGAEGAEVGEVSAVDEAGGIYIFFFVVLLDFLDFFLEVVLDVLNFFKFFEHFLVAEFHAIHIDTYRAFDTSSVAFAHSAPIFEGVGDEGVGGDGGDGFIPVLDFNGIERDFEHFTIGAVFWHFDPVAGSEHIVGGDLDTGDES